MMYGGQPALRALQPGPAPWDGGDADYARGPASMQQQQQQPGGWNDQAMHAPHATHAMPNSVPYYQFL